MYHFLLCSVNLYYVGCSRGGLTVSVRPCPAFGFQIPYHGTIQMKDFEAQFVNDLESLVVHPFQFTVPTTWNPRMTACPERHKKLGHESSIPLQMQYDHLMKNAALNDIQSMLLMDLEWTQYKALSTDEIHLKEQVWLFAYRWLTKYMNELSVPGALRSEFYKQQNDRFLGVLAGMLQYDPTKRLTFVQALKIWMPRSSVLKPIQVPDAVDDDESDDVVCDEPDPSTKDQVKPTNLPQSSSNVLKSRRLVLKVHVDSSGRSKTRKNPHS